jgi:hypothetical protein
VAVDLYRPALRVRDDGRVLRVGDDAPDLPPVSRVLGHGFVETDVRAVITGEKGVVTPAVVVHPRVFDAVSLGRQIAADHRIVLRLLEMVTVTTGRCADAREVP